MAFDLPLGFRMAGVHCGIKKKAGAEDLTLIVGDQKLVAAGVYTQNVVRAAPVAWDQQVTPSDQVRTVIVNSGNANACTGERGWQDACRMAELAAATCGAQPQQALVMSTGIIGKFLPMERIEQGVRAAYEQLGRDQASWHSAARGILTTDQGMKVAQRTVQVDDCEIRLAGMAKGAGMIGPRMATMLAVMLTDAPLTPHDAQAALQYAVDRSFNCISVEGHMSTNDTVLLLASGQVAESNLTPKQLAGFRTELTEACIQLARQIPDDGEGASHLITIDVDGCRDREEAHRIARTVAASPLVKTAITGGDPNWGRIVSAAGYSGVAFDPAQVALELNGTCLFRQGQPVAFDARSVSESIRSSRGTHIHLTFGEGEATVRFWTSDLTIEYVQFNADYST